MNMVFNEKFKAIESLFTEDKGFTVLKIEGRNAGDEQFYLAIVRYCFNNFQILLKKNKTNYTVMRISCDRDFVISCKNKTSHASSFPIVISKPTASFELEMVTNIPFVLKDVKQICQKMLDETFSFSEKDSFRKIASYEKDIF